MEATSDLGDNFGEKLKLNKELTQFITSQKVQRSLKDSSWKLLKNGDLTITLSYKIASQKSTQMAENLHDASAKPTRPVSCKKKTPSRRRRDQNVSACFWTGKNRREPGKL